jgi:hypothetical protein
MTLILLTGAGFTRNWGGWLANEAFEYVLGRPEVSGELRRRLWEDKLEAQGFEDTLAKLQLLSRKLGDVRAGELLQEFMMALVAMFNAMNLGLLAVDYDWHVLATFLARFDLIFTLNQDLLLECHYLGRGQRKFDAVRMPGLKEVNPQPYIGPVSALHTKWTPQAGKLEIEPRVQPYIKLHGSSNWTREGAQPRLLVLGGGKEIEITQDPLLNWYQQVFSQELRRPGTKLMVIGYSFGDEHINKAIEEAADEGGLTVFIVDPAGVDVLKSTKTLSGVIHPQTIRDRLSPHIRGASRRLLLSTFGDDRVEHNKILTFLS